MIAVRDLRRDDDLVRLGDIVREVAELFAGIFITIIPVLAMLKALQAKRGFAMMFVGHDIEIVRWVSDRIAVMQKGVFVETGAAQELVAQPQHPYTRSLLAARPHRPASAMPSS